MDILLVDDERLVRICTQSMLEELLTGTDVSYHHAGGAAQARAWIAEHGAPSLGFVDYKMPKCSGIEFLLQVHPLCPETVWVFLSGYDVSAEAGPLRRCGVRYILAKPVSLEDLERILRESGFEKEMRRC
ncbi:response regulator [Pseudoflavonifractor sp. CLA-AP-H29]|uniref:Stage 0 sporulation protein A homolog n=1 Tax=Pseudoflavonifractor intestinihominis TaxID=3133171 RepID=A0ABV1E8L9_9FIRM